MQENSRLIKLRCGLREVEKAYSLSTRKEYQDRGYRCVAVPGPDGRFDVTIHINVNGDGCGRLAFPPFLSEGGEI